jgi:hypothetical protein
VWTFHTADPSEPTARGKLADAASRLHDLEHQEAELVKRLVMLKERHAFAPREVTGRQVAALASKLEAVRAEVDAVRVILPAPAD